MNASFLRASLIILVWSASVWALSAIENPALGRKSDYTDTLIQTYREWPKGANFCGSLRKEPRLIHDYLVPTAKDPYYVGQKKCLTIQAPLERVLAVLSDYSQFTKLFPGFRSVTALKPAWPDTVLLHWEIIIPLFFVPDQSYDIAYATMVKKGRPKVAFCRYQLYQGNRLQFNDGLDILESAGRNVTFFYNVEFYKADYSLIGINTVTAKDVWEESIKGTFRSLAAIRLRSEFPVLSQSEFEKRRDEDAASSIQIFWNERQGQSLPPTFGEAPKKAKPPTIKKAQKG